MFKTNIKNSSQQELQSCCFCDHVSPDINKLWLLLCYLRVPFQLASPPGFHVTHIPKGKLVCIYKYVRTFCCRIGFVHVDSFFCCELLKRYVWEGASGREASYLRYILRFPLEEWIWCPPGYLCVSCVCMCYCPPRWASVMYPFCPVGAFCSDVSRQAPIHEHTTYL